MLRGAIRIPLRILYGFRVSGSKKVWDLEGGFEGRIWCVGLRV